MMVSLLMVSLHFSQEAGTTRGIRPPPVGSPSFAELETRQPGVKIDSQNRGRQAQKSRATSQRTAIHRRLLIFRVAIGNLTVEASSAVRESVDRKQRSGMCAGLCVHPGTDDRVVRLYAMPVR